MPSKKKSSKTPSKISNSDVNGGDFSPSPSFSSTVTSPFRAGDDEFSSSLDEASQKFPYLISKSAFVGRIADDTVLESRGCKIWLSESAMVSSSIQPESLVAVSLASLDEFPLSSLSDECARHFGFELTENLADEAGSFFALATVSCNAKVLKNGVRLSSNLSCTLGCPASGRTVFVHSLRCQPLNENGKGNVKPYGLTFSSLPVDRCSELCLSLVYSKDKLKMKSATSSRLDSSKEIANGTVENSNISSPKTPSISRSQVSSPSSTRSHTTNYDESISKKTSLSDTSTDILDVKEVLGDECSRKLLETCTTSWLYSRSLLSGNFVTVPVLSRICIFQVVGSERTPLDNEIQNTNIRDPDLKNGMGRAFYIDWETQVRFLLPENSVVETSITSSLGHSKLEHVRDKEGTGDNFSKLGGLSKEFNVLKDIIVSSAVKGTVARLGLRPIKGVLLHGPPGTGKTTLARLCANEAGVNLFFVNGPEIICQYQGESEQALHEVFDKATKAAPAVIFIDELDAIAPARKDGGDELSQRMVATLLNLMDGISRSDGIIIIAATNRPDSIEPALRRPGRLDREIEIGVPSPGQRHEIVLVLLSKMRHSLLDKDIQHIAMSSHGFVGADLAALCNEAALVRLRKCVEFTKTGDDSGLVCQTSNVPDSVEDDIFTVTFEDFEKARGRVRPSAMREVNLEVPKVSWEDVGGQTEVKAQLMEAVLWPQKHNDAFKRIGTRPPTGILLFGPPGCSKTLLARAVASEAGLNFLAVKGPELFSKWVGESEKAVRSLFAKARANAPSIIFFDEIDGLASIRGKESDGVSVGDRVMSQLLVELDGLQQRVSVTVIAATNRPDKIDSALLRPGRFDRLLFVGLPNKKDREDIFRVHLRKMPCTSDVYTSELSLLTDGCTGADISLICREAALAAIEEDLSASEITMDHLKAGIKLVQPSDVCMYENLSSKFQRLVHTTAREDNSMCETLSSEICPISFWTRIRSAVQFLYRLPTFLTRPDPS